ncbi:hypothetical protein CaCOL14_009564 [Colletotrichum acutatum]
MDPNYTKAETQTFHLSDGRTLSFAVFGAGAETFNTTTTTPSSPTQQGQPCPTAVLFYFHGFPSSHEEASIFHQAARRQAVQIIALDRPGHAGSMFQSNRRIVDWPADVLAFADHFTIPRFGVLGLSGGAPTGDVDVGTVDRAGRGLGYGDVTRQSGQRRGKAGEV